MVGNILFSNGQTISGIVKDSSDDTPVAGVNIVMPSLKKDVVLCRQNTVQWCNGSTTDSGPVCPSSNLGWTTLKT